MKMITVILNGYRRGYALGYQYNSIISQSIKPKEIMLWQNAGEIFNQELTNKMIHANCNKNFGVWSRFAFALNAETEYICIFDDDTMPGRRWLENCLDNIEMHDGLLGTIGVRFLSKSSYQPVERIGWANPNVNIEEVDIVGHSWFFKREWLSTFWREMPEIGTSRIVGEDIHFSYTLQKFLNKKTYVPPHPPNNMELWGSNPAIAWKLGRDSSAISMNQANLNEMSKVYTSYINKGFITINQLKLGI